MCKWADDTHGTPETDQSVTGPTSHELEGDEDKDCMTVVLAVSANVYLFYFCLALTARIDPVCLLAKFHINHWTDFNKTEKVNI